jgi:hypothetical protein
MAVIARISQPLDRLTAGAGTAGLLATSRLFAGHRGYRAARR